MCWATTILTVSLLAALSGALPAAAQEDPLGHGQEVYLDDVEIAELQAHAMSSAEQLTRALQAYDNGEYERTLDMAAEIDVRDLDRDQRIELHELMGRVLFIVGQEEQAKLQFFEVLKLDPQYELDRFRTPERIRWAFWDTKDDYTRELKWYPVDLWRTVPGKRAPLVAERDRFFAILPFGAFHFGFLHTPGRGAALAITQGLTLGASIATWAWLDWSRDRCTSVTIQEARPTVLTVNIIVSAVFVVIYASGVIDGFASQRYHRAAQGGSRRRAAAAWRWGPPVGVLPGGPD